MPQAHSSPPEVLLDWAYLSSSLSVENALFDLYVHMIILSVKNAPTCSAGALEHEKSLQWMHLTGTEWISTETHVEMATREHFLMFW